MTRKQQTPKIGPEPTLLSRKEVDALYETLSIIQHHLNSLSIRFIVTGGSLLGAIRQHSILFCDDDVDIAIIDEDGAYDKVRLHLPSMLSDGYQYQTMPWPGGDRVRPRKMNNVFVDIFCLRRYKSEQELIDVIGVKANGQAQSEEYVHDILRTIQTAAFSQGETLELYPCWQFSTRKAIEMWPKEVYRESELFPLSLVNMGPIIDLSAPRVPVLLLKRAFGRDCFEVFYQSISHSHQTSGNDNLDKQQEQETPTLPPLTNAGGTWESQTKQPLKEQHYVPMQPSSKAKRRYTDHDQSTFFAYLETQSKIEKEQLGLVCCDQNTPTQHCNADSRTVYMDGVFDLFHIGHLKAIEECAKLGNRVVIGVTGDKDAAGYKRTPIMDQKERTAIISAIRVVDKVICPCPLVVTEDFMNEHEIDLVVHGFASEADAARQKAFFEIPMKLGKFQQISYTAGVSTTERIAMLPKDSKKWFGSCISEATNRSPSIPFDPFPLDLRIAMEPHLNKALKLRSGSLEAIRAATGKKSFDRVLSSFKSLPVFCEGEFYYNVDEHDLRQKLLLCLENNCGIELSQLHKSSTSKDALLQSLVGAHNDFQQAYDEFVRAICIPKMAIACLDKETTFYYQSFPCVRIVQPGEFSIGPHADVNYGHHPCSINCYALLTDITKATSSSILFLESAPNRQDWHAILGNYGKIHHFAGALTTHWTTDNNTDSTRVSLDFRIIPGSIYHAMKCGGSIAGGKKDVYRAKYGYYTSCKKVVVDEDTTNWIRNGPILSPVGDPRFGFPWTRSKKCN